MSLKTFVKISKIDNLSDARYCAGMMVDILGFNLEEGTTGYVDPQSFKEIAEWVAGVKFAGEFQNASGSEIKLATTNYPIDYIEVQNVDLLEELADLQQDLILKLIISDEKDLGKLEAQVIYAQEFTKYVIIDCLKPEFHEEIQRILLQSKAENLVRSYDLSEATAPSVADDEAFIGIELEGSPEERPGYKDYGVVMDILEVLEEE